MSKSKEKKRINYEWLTNQPLNTQMQLLSSHFEMCRIVINSILDQEVDFMVGERYSHDKPHDGKYNRWGYNPGSVRIGSTKLKLDIPRVMDMENKQALPLETAKELKNIPEQTDQIIKGVIHGLSMRREGEVLDILGEGFGLSKSSISRKFIEGSEDVLRDFQKRKLDQHDIVAVFLDGKYMRKEQVIIALGVLSNGHKITLGFIHAPSESSGPVREFLQSLKKRGLKFKQGILWIIDGSKGLQKAIRQEFGHYAIIQRCIWHKFENIKKYLPEKHQDEAKKMYYDALDQPTYGSAKIAMQALEKHLRKLNESAANSLLEALDEILTLHKLEIKKQLHKSLRTSNCIESLNAAIQDRMGRIKRFTSSNQRFRWVAMSLMEIEQNLRRIRGYKHIHELQKSLLKFVKNAK